MKKLYKRSIIGKRLRIFGSTTMIYQEILFLISILGVSIFFKYKLISITIIKGKQYFPPTINHTVLHLAVITPDIQEMVLGTPSAFWLLEGQVGRERSFWMKG